MALQDPCSRHVCLLLGNAQLCADLIHVVHTCNWFGLRIPTRTCIQCARRLWQLPLFFQLILCRFGSWILSMAMVHMIL